MTKFKCKSCGGTYVDTQIDSTQYFHVCPPSVPPPDTRNENPPSTEAKDAGKIIAAGKGATVV